MSVGRYRVVYLAHPVSGDVPANLARARLWLRWLYERLGSSVVLVAPWILDVEILPLRDAVLREREISLERCLATVQRCEAVMLIGGRVSAGMLAEARHAVRCGLRVLDLTGYGEVPPVEVETVELLEWRPE